MKKIYFIVAFIIYINLGNFLDLTEKAIPSDIIVVLGGGSESRIVKGFDLYVDKFSLSNKILIPNKKYVRWELGKDFLSNLINKNNIELSNIVNLEYVSNTMEEIIEVKQYLKKNNLNSVMFVSHPSHSFRIKLLANLIAKYDSNIQLTFVSADDTKVWNKQYYFLEWESIKLVFLELVKIPYNLIKYTIFL